ncbi:GAF and ANTAR domain-containing protein [Aeromicrobium terrae]|uniref:GAF and ANTAR domain-containing protein n=1 Tax=Aeromicrobium terrae TaxID=2498846 RepID=UPI0016502739|nr:GAF and ANTAR domain-containing protein [Aeromicrobium terrae]
MSRLLSQMSRELADLDTHAGTVEAVTRYACTAVGCEDAGLMLVMGRNRVETPAGTSEDVDRAHQLQAELDEGPCLDSVRGGDELHLVNDIAGDPRWPAWGPAAAELGYRSTIGASLETATRRIGSLNLYSRRAGAFDEADVEVARLLAAHATVALAAADTEQQLRAAVESRTIIGQAQGIVMRAFDLDASRAFAYLTRLSQDQNIKLSQVAEQVIADRHRIGRS